MAIVALARSQFGSTGGTAAFQDRVCVDTAWNSIYKSPPVHVRYRCSSPTWSRHIKTHAGVTEQHYNCAMSKTAGEGQASSLNAIGREMTVRPSAVNLKFLSVAAA